MSNVWQIQIDGDARSSSVGEIRQLFDQGAISSDTQVRPEGAADWVTLGASGLLESGTATPEPQVDPYGRIEPVFGSNTLIAPKMAVRDDGWQDTQPHPWRRYFARMIDLTTLGMAIWFVIGLLLGAINPMLHARILNSAIVQNTIIESILTALLVLPLTTVLIGLTGCSVGKWVLGVRITDANGRPIGLAKAFRRELDVLFYGLGLCIPLVVLFTTYTAYNGLKDHRVSTWDERKPWVVTHRPGGAFQMILGVVGVCCWLVVIGYLRALKYAS